MVESSIGTLEGARSWPATAHIPGAVENKTCGDCKNLDPTTNKHNGRCIKHFQMRGEAYRFERDEEGNRAESWWRGLRTISRATPACKYFEPAPAETNPEVTL